MARMDVLKRFSSELNKCDFKQKRSDERRDGMRKEEREARERESVCVCVRERVCVCVRRRRVPINFLSIEVT